MGRDLRKKEKEVEEEMRGIIMKEKEDGVLKRREKIVEDLRVIVKGEGVVDKVNEMRVLEKEGIKEKRKLKMVVVMKEKVEKVEKVMRYWNENEISVVKRGEGN